MHLGRLGAAFGRAGPAHGGGIPAPALASLGAQIVFWGDGVMSEGAAPGIRCGPAWALAFLNGRVLPSPAWMQCKSGGDMDTIYDRRNPAINQKANIAVFASQGHNDGLKTTDPDVDATQINKWKRNLDAWIAGHTGATWIPVCSTLASGLAGETSASSFNPGISICQRVWDLQEAYVVGKADARVFFIDLAEGGYVPATHSSDTNNVHPNSEGGYKIGSIIFDALDAKIEAATKNAVLELLRGGTYPGITGSNLHPDVLLTGTGGTKAGTVAPTGDYATGQRITNNLTNGTSVAVTCSKDTTPDPYDLQLAVISGTPASENTVVQDDTANITLTGATKGQYPLLALGVTVDDGAGAAPTGLVNFGNVMGSYGGLFSTGSLGSAGGSFAHAIDAALLVPPKAIFGGGAFTVNPQICVTRWAASALTGRVIIDRPCIYLLSTPSQSAAAYIGGDTILGSNYLLRLTGTVTDAGGGTVTVETGSWAPYGVTFGDRRIYKGGGAGGTEGGSNLGAGTLLATINGTTWTYAVQAADVVAGDVIYVEVDATSGVGGTATARSNSGITVS